MKKYNLMGINYIVDGDEIYKQIGTDQETADQFAESEPVKTDGRGRKKGSKNKPNPGAMIYTQKKIAAYKPTRKHLGEEAEQTIVTDIRENKLSLAVCCKKYEIAVSTYYRLRDIAQSGEVKESSNEQLLPPTT